ncbi:hypothetical protein GCM10028806_41240 [Spirosoma terrae]|uniref:Uncharacterized protein n=1 Tax=Spirosoma terrae TaxID=1968276 RepID=A0A6L9LBK7_9BACT|nr:hypothetical protein [Spirosoma terrae]NDU94209.1 hypothetical protein [Spirosoma terrae]
MMNVITTVAFAVFMTGAAIAQDKPAKRTAKTSSSTTGTLSPVDAARSNPSAANTHDGTMGASTGTGTTLEQNQAANAGGNRTTSTDATSSVRKKASTVKAKKKKTSTDSQ